MKYKRILLLILIPISYILTLTAKNNITFAEVYAAKIYPVFAGIVSFFTSKIPVSVAEFIIIIMIILILINIVKVIIDTVKLKTFKSIYRFIINILAAASCIYFLFVLFCGLNYYRYEFTYYSGLEIKPSTKEELIELCERLINDANNLKTNINKDENNILSNVENYYEIANLARSSFDDLSKKYEILEGNYPAPKPVIFSKVMSHSRITGVFFPFTFEANVNVDIPKYQIPSTMLHELVHLRGFMREDEANFISYLACINSGYDEFTYSGTMLALTYSMNALYAADYDAFVSLYHNYSKDVINDIKLSSEYWKQFDTKIAQISNKVNDTYLKANNQKDGVKSYGRMIDLLLAYYR